MTNDGKKFSMMCSLDIYNKGAVISSIVFYDDAEEDYYSLDDVVKEIGLPLTINIELTINKRHSSLIFSANKADIYKNEIKTTLNSISKIFSDIIFFSNRHYGKLYKTSNCNCNC